MEFLDELNKRTNGKYDYLRVKSVTLTKKPPLAEIEMLAPYEVLDRFFGEEDKETILETSRQILPDSFDIKIFYLKSYIDSKIVTNHILNYFKEKHPTIMIDSADIEVKIIDDKAIANINLKSMFYDYFKNKDIETQIKQYMSHCFCNEIDLVISDNKEDVNIECDIASEESITIISRRVTTYNHLKLIGRDISVKPRYIADCKDIEDNAVYCGRVVDFKKNKSKKSGLPYYVFTLEDTSGLLCCKAFTKKDGDCEYDKLNIGQEVIVSGKVAMDTFMHDYALLVNSLSFCQIDYSSIILKEELKGESEYYKVLKPYPIKDFTQQSFFTADNAEEIPKSLRNKDFVVFDFETTGLDKNVSEIIELGAVKVRNGIITEGFGSFVKPNMPISEEITNLTTITNKDVENAPKFEDIIGDFYKFTRGAGLVAHNAGFDKGFLDKYAKECRYLFDNNVYDTIELAKKVSGIKAKNYKLGSLCDALGISLEGAHRAVNDCEATAKLFIYLAKAGALD